MAERSDTKRRILATALDLFNLEGEGEVSAVDIASVMGISPGNLYYHYKGKEPIIAALWEDFEAEIRQVLGAPVARPLAMDDNWIYLFIVFEEIWDFRFFYRDPAGIIARVPELGARFSHLLALKEETARALLGQLEHLGALEFRPSKDGAVGARDALAERLAQHVSVWVNYRSLRRSGGGEAKRELINAGVHQALQMIAPFARDEVLFAEGLEATARQAPV